MKVRCALAVCLAWWTVAAPGQTPDLPEFEVASVKPAAPADGPLARMSRFGPMAEMIGFSGGPGSSDPGRITYTGVTLKMLLVRAYQVRPYQISGPDWLETERYDILAKLPPNTDGPKLSLMLQKLLTERFQITLHREMRELSVYAVTVAKNGPKLKPALPAKHQDRAEILADLTEKVSAQKDVMKQRGFLPFSRGLGLDRATVTAFAQSLSSSLNLPVIDMTHLEGLYSFDLHWVADEARVSGRVDDVDTGPTIFAAVQEQLGLKLEPGKSPIEILVIDKANRAPTEN